MGFVELFYQCAKTQSSISGHLGKTYSNTIKQVKKIMALYIDFYNPTLIIVTNAYAARLIYNALKKDEPLDTNEIDIKRNGKDDKDLDTDEIDIKHNGKDKSLKTDEVDITYNGKKVKVLFSSMLFGSRSLDIGSYHRLERRIECFIEKDLKNK